MATEPRSIHHPAWCDLSRCTAPRAGKPIDLDPAHRSARLDLPDTTSLRPITSSTGTLSACVYKPATPWPSDTFLALSADGAGEILISLAPAGAAQALLAHLIRAAATEIHRCRPELPEPAAAHLRALVDTVPLLADDPTARAASRCRARLGVWIAVHDAMQRDADGQRKRVRVTLPSGDQSVGHVVSITDAAFEIASEIDEAYRRFNWPDVLAVTSP